MCAAGSGNMISGSTGCDECSKGHAGDKVGGGCSECKFNYY